MTDNLYLQYYFLLYKIAKFFYDFIQRNVYFYFYNILMIDCMYTYIYFQDFF